MRPVKISHGFPDPREIGIHKEIQKSADNRPQRDGLGQSPVRVVEDLPIPQTCQNSARNGEEHDKQRFFPLRFLNAPKVRAVTPVRITCHDLAP